MSTRSRAKPWFMEWRAEREEAAALARPAIPEWKFKWDDDTEVTVKHIHCSAPGWNSNVVMP